MRAIAGCALAALLLAGCTKDKVAAGPWSTKVAAGETVYATLHTNQGDITVKLYAKESPKTVLNFVGLATGEKEWTNPADGQKKAGVPLYDGTVFHRVIEGFMIQGGDPLGSGRGDPGYRFEDETSNGLRFEKVGLLAMANAGPNTNGSQFFITTSLPAQLNGKHTIFGETVKGYEVVEKISKVPRSPGDRPIEPVTVSKVELSSAAP